MGEVRDDEVLEREYDSADSSDEEERGLQYAYACSDSSEDEAVEREPGGGLYDGDLLSDCEGAAGVQARRFAGGTGKAALNISLDSIGRTTRSGGG